MPIRPSFGPLLSVMSVVVRDTHREADDLVADGAAGAWGAGRVGPERRGHDGVGQANLIAHRSDHRRRCGRGDDQTAERDRD